MKRMSKVRETKRIKAIFEDLTSSSESDSESEEEVDPTEIYWRQNKSKLLKRSDLFASIACLL